VSATITQPRGICTGFPMNRQYLETSVSNCPKDRERSWSEAG